MHQLMSENFQLKEEINLLQNELREVIESREELKGQLRVTLGEVSANDEIIEKCRQGEEDLIIRIKELGEGLKMTKLEL